MTDDGGITVLMEKSGESIRAAEVLHDEGLYDFSASRAYYSMFYLAEAILLTKNMSFSKHSAVIAAFGREFIKNHKLPRKLRTHLVEAFDLRQLGDYGAPGTITREKSEKLIENAKEFLKAAKKYLKRKH